MRPEKFTPAMADQVFEYSETRFTPISKEDNCCYRCQRNLLELSAMFSMASDPSLVAPSDRPPYPQPQSEAEKDENWRWQQHNRGRNRSEAFRWSAVAGYDSNNLDGMRMCVVLCEDCKLEILGPFMKFKDVMYGPQQFHRERWKQRNDQDVQNRWDARKQRRMLHAALPKTNCDPVEKKL